MTEDPVVNRVIMRFMKRSREGMDKYGMSLEINPEPALKWVEHAQEEAMDFILYLERLKNEL